MPEKKKSVVEDVKLFRKVLLSTDDGRKVLAMLGRELGAFTYGLHTDPAEVVKANIWKRILGLLGIINASDLNQCLLYVEALSEIPPVQEEIMKEEEM